MKKPVKISLIVASQLGLAGLAFFLGFHYALMTVADDVRKGFEMATGWRLLSHYHLYLESQRWEADREAYRDALIDFMGVLDTYDELDKVVATEGTIEWDKMIALTKLSRVEAELGNDQAANDYMARALAACTETGRLPEACTPEKLTYLAERLEKDWLNLGGGQKEGE